MSDQVQNGLIEAVNPAYVAAPTQATAEPKVEPKAEAKPAPRARRRDDDDGPIRTAPAAEWEFETVEEPEAPKETAAEKPQAEPQPKPEIGTSLKQRAKDAGYSDDDLKEFTPATLTRALDLADRALAARREPKPEPKPEPEVKEPTFNEDHYTELGIDKEVIAELRAGFEARQAHKRLEATVQQLVQRDNDRERERATQAIDAAFAELDGQYSGLFGKGAYGELDQESREFNRRTAVVLMAQQEIERERAAGRKLSVRDAQARAADALFGHAKAAAQEPAAPEPARDLPPRDDAGRFTPTHRPQSRHAVKAVGEKAALETIREAMGISGPHPEDTVDDSML